LVVNAAHKEHLTESSICTPAIGGRGKKREEVSSAD